jgi:amino acid adenylation domain-containing protein
MNAEVSASAAESSAPAPETGLQLPYEQVKAPGLAASFACHSFELPAARAIPLEVLLTAGFGIQLARYSGQLTVPLQLARARSVGSLTLEISAGESGDGMVEQVTRLLNRKPSGKAVVQNLPAAIFFNEPSPSSGSSGWLDAFVRSGLPELGVDLCLVANRASSAVAFIYDAALFPASTIARFAGHLLNILEGIVRNPRSSVYELELLTDEDRRILKEGGQGETRDHPFSPLHRHFERHVATTPDATALRFKDRALSYGDLNAQANRLAHFLRARQIGAESRVVVCVEPGFDIAIALLGIHKAGAVYVPLDPTYPKARIDAILEDTRPALVIAPGYLVERLSLGAFPALSLEQECASITGFDSHNPDVSVDPAQAAYIYYTSGTTGKPKGVVATHRNLAHYILVAQKRYGFTAGDVMPAIARFSFSISMFELMSPLAAGATLLILEREHVVDLSRMSQTFQEITFFHAGPSLLKNLLAYIRGQFASFDAFAKVRHASSGGDMVPPEVLESLKEIFSNAEVFVIYGCSEVSCMGVTYQAPRDRTLTRTYVGRPFENMAVKVLDAARQPVPVGVAGEICFAGSGIVRGYLNRAELTAEKFVDVAGQRFYCTGDMGRFSNAGQLEILGRRDFQIQLRGMRIELGDVEYTLRHAPGVKDGVVMTKQAANGEKILVAYIVFASSSAGKVADVRRHMVDHLPDYMVPASYVELQSLPLNHNMKVDRHALPNPPTAMQRAAETVALREPRTPTQKLLARLWCEALRLQTIGLDDNFIELGGDSISGTELILAVERELQATIDGMEVLRESLEVMADLCDQRRTGAAAVATSAGVPVRDSDEVMETFYFGRDSGLYGVLHLPKNASPSRALLICSPMGQENVRSHFVLQRLSRLMASRGIAVMRFDYFGSGDSLGEGFEATYDRWRRDIVEACKELQRRSGTTDVSALGVRLGGTLLYDSLSELELSRLVLWDPVVNGAEYLAEIELTQQQRLKSLQSDRLGRQPKRQAGRRELLGFIYPETLLAQLSQLKIQRGNGAARTRLHCVVTPSESERVAAAIGEGDELVAVEFECNWRDAAYLEDVIPDTGFTKALVRMVAEH